MTSFRQIAANRRTAAKSTGPTTDFDFARRFLRLANLPNFELDRLSRYEATLWRQAAQTLFALDQLNGRKRGGRFFRARIFLTRHRAVQWPRFG